MFRFNKKEKNKDTVEGLNRPIVHVVLCRPLNKNTVTEVLEFDAEQRRNEDYNFFIVNETQKFMQEIDFNPHPIIEQLNYKLGLTSFNKDEKIKIINEKIAKLEKQKMSIKDGKLDDEKINVIDIDNDLGHLQVLKYVVEYEGEGSFEIFNSKGQREIRFLAREGNYYPYFFHSDTSEGKVIDIVPDKALKQKYWRENDGKIEERFLKNKSGNFWEGAKGIIITIVIAAMVLVNIMAFIELNKARSELGASLQACEERANKIAVNSAAYYEVLMRNEIINKSIDISYLDETTETKETTSALVDITNKITANT